MRVSKRTITILTICLLTMAGVQNVKAQEFYRKNDLEGIIYNGKKLTEAKYADLMILESARLVGFKSKENYQWGIFDLKTGKEITPAKYDFVTPSLSGTSVPYRYVQVEKDGLWTYVDAETGKEIAPMQYDETRPFYEQEVAVVKRGGKETLMNTKGKELFPPKYDRIDYFDDDGLALVLLNGQWGYLSQDGVEVIPVQFDNAFPFHCGIALVADNTKDRYAYINKKGALITPYIYEDAANCTEGLAPVQKDGKWGYIDASGNQVIPFIYDDAYNFEDGEAEVTINGKDISIDKNGNEIKR